MEIHNGIMENAARDIEITVLSAEDLRIKSRLIRKNAFAIVRTDPDDQFSTRIDEQGASYPSWNQKFNAKLPKHARFITVEVHRKSSKGGDKFIGMANVPVSDILGGYTPENYLHFLSYRLRDRHGERNGIINLSIRVKTMIEKDREANNFGKMENISSSSSSAAAAPRVGVPTGQKDLASVVTGIPIWRPHTFSV